MEGKVFRQYLESKGLRLTKERASVLREVFSLHGHFEPEQLYLRLKGSGDKASRASVYRTLTLLLESGLVEKVTRTDKGAVYEHTFGHNHHDHMICTACGQVIEFYSKKLEDLQAEICSNHSFAGQNHTLEIRGCCRRCSRTDR